MLQNPEYYVMIKISLKCTTCQLRGSKFIRTTRRMNVLYMRVFEIVAPFKIIIKYILTSLFAETKTFTRWRKSNLLSSIWHLKPVSKSWAFIYMQYIKATILIFSFSFFFFKNIFELPTQNLNNMLLNCSSKSLEVYKNKVKMIHSLTFPSYVCLK